MTPCALTRARYASHFERTSTERHRGLSARWNPGLFPGAGRATVPASPEVTPRRRRVGVAASAGTYSYPADVASVAPSHRSRHRRGEWRADVLLPRHRSARPTLDCPADSPGCRIACAYPPTCGSKPLRGISDCAAGKPGPVSPGDRLGHENSELALRRAWADCTCVHTGLVALE